MKLRIFGNTQLGEILVMIRTIKILSFIVAALLWQEASGQTGTNSATINLSDSLEGKWRGEFYDQINFQTTQIELFFKKNKGQLKIYGYSYHPNTTLRSQLKYEKITNDSIRLTEFAIVGVDTRQYPSCRQTMFLHVAKEENDIVMSGVWEIYEYETRKSCVGNGSIHFKKVR